MVHPHAAIETQGPRALAAIWPTRTEAALDRAVEVCFHLHESRMPTANVAYRIGQRLDFWHGGMQNHRARLGRVGEHVRLPLAGVVILAVWVLGGCAYAATWWPFSWPYLAAYAATLVGAGAGFAIAAASSMAFDNLHRRARR